MSVLAYIAVFSFGGSLLSMLCGAAMLSRHRLAARVSHAAAPFAAGTLLATTFLDLLPEAARKGKPEIFVWTLLGILIFFFIERFILEFHHQHTHAHIDHDGPAATAPLLIVGGTLHKLIDGIVIAGTFLVSIPVGIVTTVAVATHEIPHVIGGLGLLLHSGMSRAKVFAYIVLSGLTTVGAAIATGIIGSRVVATLPAFLALTSGFFVYIAASDLIPEIHKHERRNASGTLDVLLLLVGIAVIWVVVGFLE